MKFGFCLFPTRWIFLQPARPAARVEQVPHLLRLRSPPEVGEALQRLAARPASSGRPGVERREGQGQAGARQRLLPDPQARPAQTRGVLLHVLFLLRLGRGGLLPGAAHTAAPAAPQTAADRGPRQRGGAGEGAAERLGTEGQLTAQTSSQSWCKGQR